MPIFDWRGRNNRGEADSGKLEAMTEGGVADQLKSIGVAPVFIAVAPVEAEGQGTGRLATLTRKPVDDVDLMVFSRQV